MGILFTINVLFTFHTICKKFLTHSVVIQAGSKCGNGGQTPSLSNWNVITEVGFKLQEARWDEFAEVASLVGSCEFGTGWLQRCGRD